MPTNHPDIAVALFDQHIQAENAVKSSQRAGFDMEKISIIGKDYQWSTAQVVVSRPNKRLRIGE